MSEYPAKLNAFQVSCSSISMRWSGITGGSGTSAACQASESTNAVVQSNGYLKVTQKLIRIGFAMLVTHICGIRRGMGLSASDSLQVDPLASLQQLLDRFQSGVDFPIKLDGFIVWLKRFGALVMALAIRVMQPLIFTT